MLLRLDLKAKQRPYSDVGPLIAPILLPSPWVSKPGWFSRLYTYLLVHGEPNLEDFVWPI